VLHLSKIKKLSGSSAWIIIAAFGAYFCMYGFRKPYTAATYSDNILLGLDFKSLLILSQTLGYVTAKWAGIKIIAEINPEKRVKALLLLICFAELMLLLFGIVPKPWNAICIFLNGLPLGMVFGLVLGYLEGRKHTEALIACLCASFIVSDGVAKSAGQWLLNLGVAETWMPFVAGLLFAVPLLLFAVMLSVIPKPGNEDINARSERLPMNGTNRKQFFFKYAPGLIAIIITYLLVTLLRSLRADFAPEIWQALGYKKVPALFTQSELIVSFAVVIITGFVILITNHYKALQTSLLTCCLGFVLLIIAIYGYKNGFNGFAFMVIAGLGVYIPYVAIHTTIFERLIALTRERANVGFLMYVADSAGYTGYIILMLFKYFFSSGYAVLPLFIKMSIVLGIAGLMLVLYCTRYFFIRFAKKHSYANRLSAR
jgi:hypothetical protein